MATGRNFIQDAWMAAKVSAETRLAVPIPQGLTHRSRAPRKSASSHRAGATAKKRSLRAGPTESRSALRSGLSPDSPKTELKMPARLRAASDPPVIRLNATISSRPVGGFHGKTCESMPRAHAQRTAGMRKATPGRIRKRPGRLP
jgi:hypothetical protein